MENLRLSTEFKRQAKKLFDDIGSIISINNSSWEEELKAAISIAEQSLTDDQKEIIINKSSKTLATYIKEEGDSLSTPLSHAFTDPIKKGQELLSAIGNEGDFLDDESTLKALLSIKETLLDVNHNYTLLLGENLPINVNRIINEYVTNIIPKLHIMITNLSNSSPDIDVNSIKIDTLGGKEHLGRLPTISFDGIS